MKKLFYILFVFYSLFLVLACEEGNPVLLSSENININLEKRKRTLVTNSIIIEKIKKGKFIIDTSTVIINAFPCGVKDVYVWLTDHYEIANGKYLGIWPQSFTQNSYNSYKNYYGLNQIIVSSTQHISWALNAGYSRDNLMGNVNFNPGSVSHLGYLKYYYLDEPLEKMVRLKV